MTSTKVLLFIPTYNCATQLERVLEGVVKSAIDEVTEVLVIDNRSKDETVKVATTFRDQPRPGSDGLVGKLKVVRNVDNYGLGGSQKVAFAYAIEHGFDRVVILHGDDQADASDVPKMLHLMSREPELDAVLGNRFDPSSRVSGYSKTRIWGNRLLNLLYSLVLFERVQDLGSGVNAYKVSSLAKLDFGRYSDYCDFNFYLLLASLEARWKMRLVPIIWREEDQISNTNALRMGVRALKALWGWRFRRSMILVPDRPRSFEIC